MSNITEDTQGQKNEKRDSNIPYYYINAMAVSASYYDFQIVCSNNVLDTATKTMYNRELCDIIMSPQHAKELCNILSNYIKEYEKKFGILTPPVKNTEVNQGENK